MNAHHHHFPAASVPVVTPGPDTVLAAAEAAGRRIAPVWPLASFVAVNPFLGLADRPFAEAAGIVAATGARMTMPRTFYAEAIAAGRIGDADLAAAIAATDGLRTTVAGLKALAANDGPTPEPLATVADVAARTTGTDWAAIATNRIAAWATAWFDAGQALWRAPCQRHAAYGAWRTYAAHDRTPGALGLPGLRRFVRSLPATADETILLAVERLGLSEAALVPYFHRLLATVGGVAALARQRLWQAELAGGTDGTLRDVLAIRLAWDAALLDAFGDDPAVTRGWREARTMAAVARSVDPADIALQTAYEIAYQRTLAARLARPSAANPARKAVQAAFCIDVRSEVFRRALEATSANVETIGFAGFFGVPIDLVPLGHEQGAAHCPVLLTPRFTVCEGGGGRQRHRRCGRGRPHRADRGGGVVLVPAGGGVLVRLRRGGGAARARQARRRCAAV